VEELGQLVFIVLFILFGLLSGKRKKRPDASEPRARSSTIEERPDVIAQQDIAGEPETGTEPDEVVSVPSSAGNRIEVEGRRRNLADELLNMLQGAPEPTGSATVSLPPVDDEAQSLEDLQPIGWAREEFEQEDAFEIRRHEAAQSAEPAAELPRPYAVRGRSSLRPYQVEETLEPEPYAIKPKRGRRRDLSRSELRHAFVMREVLGPPKALEE